MTTFCLIHGAWHDGACWEPLAARLRARGHDVDAPDLPYHDPLATYHDRVRPALDALDGVDGDIVVVGHSLGSGYAPLVAVARPGSLLVHLCPRLGPFPPPPGAPAAFRPGIPFPLDRPDGSSVWEPEAAIAFMYARLPPDTARELTMHLQPLAQPAGEFPLPGHPSVPTALVYAAEDEFFEPDFERFMARRLLGIEPLELPGGHFPMIEGPESLADLLVSL